MPFLLAVTLTWSNTSFALLRGTDGRIIEEEKANADNVSWTLLSMKDAAKYGAIGRIEIPKDEKYHSACTATFIDTNGTGNAPAYVITAGHCLPHVSMFNAPNTVLGSDVAMNRPMEALVHFNRFYDNHERLFASSYLTKAVTYATLNGADIAILELHPSFQDMLASGYKPIPLSPEHTKPGEPISSFGVPAATDGVNDPNYEQLHRSDANINDCLNSWGYLPGLRDLYSFVASMTGGQSGGPVLSRKTGTIVGINSGDINERAFADLFFADPKIEFEVPEIASDVSRAAHCFNKNGVFTLDNPGCGLRRAGGPDSEFRYEPPIDPGDEPAAIKRACATLNPIACLRLGEIHKKEEPNLAARAYAASCFGYNADGCLKLSESYRTGSGVDKSEARADLFLKKACQLGYPHSSCSKAGR